MWQSWTLRAPAGFWLSSTFVFRQENLLKMNTHHCRPIRHIQNQRRRRCTSCRRKVSRGHVRLRISWSSSQVSVMCSDHIFWSGYCAILVTMTVQPLFTLRSWWFATFQSVGSVMGWRESISLWTGWGGHQDKPSLRWRMRRMSIKLWRSTGSTSAHAMLKVCFSDKVILTRPSRELTDGNDKHGGGWIPQSHIKVNKCSCTSLCL